LLESLAVKKLIAAAILALMPILPALSQPTPVAAPAAPVPVVAAENFYGDVAHQIGGQYVAVTSILSNPDEDPHLFEASPSTGRAISAAAVVIANGAGYDSWMDKLLGASPQPRRRVIKVDALTHAPEGANPHLWYNPATMPALAKALTAALSEADPAHRPEFEAGRDAFLKSLDPLRARIAAMHEHYVGASITATEPVFGYMAAALGLKVRNDAFQLAVMNDTEPSASSVASFQKDLTGRRVRAMLFNSQAETPLTNRMRHLAEQSHVPVVGVSETEPTGLTYQQWMGKQLDALDAALSHH
jgi:zinc/manganese transport system substrate-binding protein